MNQQPFRGPPRFGQRGGPPQHFRSQRQGSSSWSGNMSPSRPYGTPQRQDGVSSNQPRFRNDEQRNPWQRPHYPNYARQPPPNNNYPANSENRPQNPNQYQQQNIPEFGHKPRGNMSNMLQPNPVHTIRNMPPPPLPSVGMSPIHTQMAPKETMSQPQPTDHFSIPPPNFNLPPTMPPIASGEEVEILAEEIKEPVIETERDSDVTWVKGWLKRRKINKKITQKSPKSLSIPEARRLFKEAVEVLEAFKEQKQILKSGFNTANQTLWQQQVLNISTVKEKFNRLKAMISSPSVKDVLHRKIEATKKRKVRLQKRKEEAIEENQEREKRKEEIEKRIDAWRNKILEKQLQKKRDIEVKEAADKILAEVRKKLADANRSMELVKAISKLRSARKSSMQSKGLYTPKEIDDNFEEKSCKLTEMLKSQILIYEAEQKTLQVMLDTEQEANLEKERELIKIREELRQEKEEKRIETMLFGKQDILGDMDPILPYRQYYEAADNDINALIQIRQAWDMYLVPPGTVGGSNIPPNWITPVNPSSETWESSLNPTPS